MDKTQHNNAQIHKFLGKMHKQVRSLLTSFSDLKINLGRWKTLMRRMNSLLLASGLTSRQVRKKLRHNNFFNLSFKTLIIITTTSQSNIHCNTTIIHQLNHSMMRKS